MEERIKQVGIEVGKKLFPDFESLSTSDFQACIEAEVGKQLTGLAASQAVEIALEYVYARYK